MQINDEIIEYLENLSRFHLSKDEKEKTKADLSKIISYMQKLNEIDTENVEELSHPFSFANNFREDTLTKSTERNIILANAPMQKDGCFKVPKTVE